jgi:hypothetical protein
MNLPKFVTVISTEMRVDKNEKDYNYIEVEGQTSEDIVLPTGKVITMQKVAEKTAFTAYPTNYLDQKDAFSDTKKGQIIMGDIVRRKVQPYDINFVDKDGVEQTRTVDTYKAFVAGDSRDKASFEIAVSKTFKQAGHEIMSGENAVISAAEAEAAFQNS